MTDSAPMQALRATVSRCVDEGAPVLTEVPARMMNGRCVHGLKAGLCNTCPTLDREPDGRWIWRAVPVRNGARNRRFMIGGFLHMVNRHGVVLREDAGNAGDGWRAVSLDWDDETTLAAKLAIDRTGIRPSCSPGYSFCRCAPRW